MINSPREASTCPVGPEAPRDFACGKICQLGLTRRQLPEGFRFEVTDAVSPSADRDGEPVNGVSGDQKQVVTATFLELAALSASRDLALRHSNGPPNQTV